MHIHAYVYMYSVPAFVRQQLMKDRLKLRKHSFKL